MHKLLLVPVSALSLAGYLAAQDSEVYVCNANTVRSTAVHAVTQQPYPYPPCAPNEYSVAGTGVLAGTRSWTYTPRLRHQGGGYGANYFTLTGMIQTIRVGAAIAILPATNHYQMRMGIAPAAPVSGGSAYQMQHAATGADLFTIADAAAVVSTRPRFEIATTLTTPVAFGPTELCFYLEFRGGEQQDDANNCQMTANDYYGGRGPSAGSFWGFTTGPATGRNVIVNTSAGLYHRPRVGLLIDEPVFTACGPHGNDYIAITGATLEDYRSLASCAANWSTATNGQLMFDVRAGSTYSSTGTALVFLNMGPVWFPGALPIAPYGNLLLNPADPGLDALLSLPLTLVGGGVYAGQTSVKVPVPALGPTSVGQFLKCQAVVFNAPFIQAKLTSASSILIY